VVLLYVNQMAGKGDGIKLCCVMFYSVTYPGILFGGGSINLVEDRGQR